MFPFLPARPPSSFLCLLALATGCSDFNLSAVPDDGETGDDDTTASPDDDATGPDDDTTPDPQGLCQDEYLPPLTTAIDTDCEPTTIGTFTPILEWEMSTFSVAPSSTDIMMPPSVANLTDDNGDGLVDESDLPDIVFITYGGGSTANGVVRCVSGEGEHIWSAEISAQGQGSVAIGDLDNDGIPEVVVVKDNLKVVALSNAGEVKWTSITLTAADVSSVCASPAIADIEGDGAVEVGVGRVILNGQNGALIAKGTRGIGSYGTGSTSFFADLDLDGTQELIAGNAAYQKDGSTRWTYGNADGYPAVGNFDADDMAEVVVISSGQISLFDTVGGRIWGPASIPGSGGGPPTVADFDGDGEPEVGVGSFGAYTVYETDGTMKWTKATQDGSSGCTGATVFDFEGDGVAEVVYADETRLWVLSGPDGSVKLEGMEHSSATWIEYPTVADVDRDGHAEIVYGRNPYTASYHGIAVVGDADDSWMPTRPIWNQHAYSITNINNDASVPPDPEFNWLTYNSFRSADLASVTGGAAGDLFPDAQVCDLDCTNFGNAFVAVYAFNQGTADVPGPINITVYKQEGNSLTYLTGIVTDGIASGYSSEGVRLSFDAAAVGSANLLVAVDDDGSGYGAIAECDETNNRLVIEGPLCP